MGAVRARRLPWVLWLHDLLPDGAAATGLVDEGSTAVRLARVLERAAYRTADSIVVLSRSFTQNLLSKGVPEAKIKLIYDPATRIPRRMADPARSQRAASPPLDGEHRLLAGSHRADPRL